MNVEEDRWSVCELHRVLFNFRYCDLSILSYCEYSLMILFVDCQSDVKVVVQ